MAFPFLLAFFFFPSAFKLLIGTQFPNAETVDLKKQEMLGQWQYWGPLLGSRGGRPIL